MLCDETEPTWLFSHWWCWCLGGVREGCVNSSMWHRNLSQEIQIKYDNGYNNIYNIRLTTDRHNELFFCLCSQSIVIKHTHTHTHRSNEIKVNQESEHWWSLLSKGNSSRQCMTFSVSGAELHCVQYHMTYQVISSEKFLPRSSNRCTSVTSNVVWLLAKVQILQSQFSSV